MSDTREPAAVFAPGEYINDELSARGWSVSDLCAAMGMAPSDADALITGKRRLLARDAEQLARVFGTSVVLWLNLERAYRQERGA